MGRVIAQRVKPILEVEQTEGANRELFYLVMGQRWIKAIDWYYYQQKLSQGDNTTEILGAVDVVAYSKAL